MSPTRFSSHQLIPMTNQLIELETINDQELQIACGGKGFKFGKSVGTKKLARAGTKVVEGLAFGAGELAVNQTADAITPSDAE